MSAINSGMTPQERIAESEILGWLARGDDKKLANKGQPLDLDAYFATPPDVRMAFSMLKTAELVPEELDLLKQINRLDEEAQSTVDPEKQAALRLRISELYAVYDMKMQSYRRNPLRR